jgi:hypothetical protein
MPAEEYHGFYSYYVAFYSYVAYIPAVAEEISLPRAAEDLHKYPIAKDTKHASKSDVNEKFSCPFSPAAAVMMCRLHKSYSWNNAEICSSIVY